MLLSLSSAAACVFVFMLFEFLYRAMDVAQVSDPPVREPRWVSKHRSAWKSSNRAKPEQFRQSVLQRIREKYSGTEQRRFGPTLAAEHLAEEDWLQVDGETLRRWMLPEGLWSRDRRRNARFGELVQLDGSFHESLEERVRADV
jgi:hypothetical protein